MATGSGSTRGVESARLVELGTACTDLDDAGHLIQVALPVLVEAAGARAALVVVDQGSSWASYASAATCPERTWIGPCSTALCPLTGRARWTG